jgi:hypothetical protein
MADCAAESWPAGREHFPCAKGENTHDARRKP